jgi:hypothetical protein
MRGGETTRVPEDWATLSEEGTRARERIEASLPGEADRPQVLVVAREAESEPDAFTNISIDELRILLRIAKDMLPRMTRRVSLQAAREAVLCYRRYQLTQITLLLLRQR